VNANCRTSFVANGIAMIVFGILRLRVRID
jgi:hypothetical protein